MRKLLLLSAALSLPGLAYAADLPAKVAVPAQSPSSGFYLGINGAGAKLSSAFDTAEAKTLLIPGTGDIHPSGAMAGVTVGAGLWNGNAYFGLEADADYDFSKANIAGCAFAIVPRVEEPVSTGCRVKSGFFFTERVIVGATLGGLTGAAVQRGAPAPSNWPVPINGPTSFYAAQIMPYITGGVAERRLAACVDLVGCNSQWLVGWTAGGGLRLPVSTNVSLDVSYLYVDWNRHFNPAGPMIFPNAFKATSEQIFKLGFGYHL